MEKEKKAFTVDLIVWSPQRTLYLKENKQQTSTLLWFTFLLFKRAITFYSVNFVALSSLNFLFIWSYWRHFSFCLQNKIEDLLLSVYNFALTIFYSLFIVSHRRPSTFCLQSYMDDPLFSVYNVTFTSFYFLFTVSHWRVSTFCL